MREVDLIPVGFTRNERALIAEAVRRACLGRFNVGVEQRLIADAIVAEARRGTWTMYGLVKVGWRAGEAGGNTCKE